MPVEEKQPHPDSPEVYAVKQGKTGWQFNRRNFLVISGAAVAAITAGCGSDAANADDTPHQISTNTPQPIESACFGIRAHYLMLGSLAFSPDGALLASGGIDKQIKLWSMPDGQLVKTLPGHTNLISALGFAAGGDTLVSGSWDKTVRIWSVTSGETLATLEGFPSTLTNLAVSPDGSTLATACGVDIKFWSLPDGAPLKALPPLPPPTSAAYSLAFSPDGTLLATGNHDGVVRLWSVQTGEVLHELKSHEEPVHAVTFSADGAYLVSAGLDAALKIWGLPSGDLLATATGHSDEINAVAVCPDGSLAATASNDGTVRLWSLPEGKPLRSLSGHKGAVNSLGISPDGRQLVSGGNDGAIFLWSLPEGALTGCAIDINAIPSDQGSAATYETVNNQGETVTYTIPCGSPIPDGAVCTCNCVAGLGECACVGHSRVVPGGNCDCVGNIGGSGSHYWHPD